MSTSLCIHPMGWWKWDAVRLLSPHCHAVRPQKSDSKNVYLASQSGFPEESFGQNSPDPGLGNLKPGEMGRKSPEYTGLNLGWRDVEDLRRQTVGFSPNVYHPGAMR